LATILSTPETTHAEATSLRNSGSEEMDEFAMDRLVGQRVRLGIVRALAVHDSLTFTDLKKMMKTTDGNLSVHARKLELAKVVSCTKSFQGRLPKTEYQLTPHGRLALERYLSAQAEKDNA
jgi:DNA-binding HxlR family transcriptional regulator